MLSQRSSLSGQKLLGTPIQQFAQCVSTGQGIDFQCGKRAIEYFYFVNLSVAKATIATAGTEFAHVHVLVAA